jgi:hypothetical protein
MLIALMPLTARAEQPEGSGDTDPLLQAAESVMDRVEQLRGISVDEPVRSAVVGRDDLRAMLVEEIERQLSPTQLASIDRLLTTLGVLRVDQDYIEILIDLLQEQIAGFYDDGEDVFYILDDMAIELQLPVMAHELFHAIQDQSFLKGRSDVVTDLAIARSALVEGDALAAMLVYSLDGTVELDQIPFIDSISESTPSADEGSEVDVPEVIWQQLTFPYTGGLTFALHLYREGGWPAVNAVYLDPPDSAEQVLHPERYLERDEPTWLEYDAAVGGARRYMSDVLGEFTWRGVLEQLAGDTLSESAILRALDGWDGDRIDAWVFDADPARDRLTVLTVWDSPDEALQFADAAERLAPAWGASGQVEELHAGLGGRRRVAASAESAVLIDVRGDLVALVLDRGGAADQRADEAATAADAIWCTHRRYAYPAAIDAPAP